MRRFAALLAALALTVAFAAPVDAGKWRWLYNVPKKYQDGTLAISYVDRDGDGVLSWNDDVISTVTPPTLLGNWYASATCSQNGTVVYTSGGLLKLGAGTDATRLDSAMWADNTGADCEFWAASMDGTTAYFWGVERRTVAP